MKRPRRSRPTWAESRVSEELPSTWVPMNGTHQANKTSDRAERTALSVVRLFSDSAPLCCGCRDVRERLRVPGDLGG